jgi:hypothetical protein
MRAVANAFHGLAGIAGTSTFALRLAWVDPSLDLRLDLPPADAHVVAAVGLCSKALTGHTLRAARRLPLDLES